MEERRRRHEGGHDLAAKRRAERVRLARQHHRGGRRRTLFGLRGRGSQTEHAELHDYGPDKEWRALLTQECACAVCELRYRTSFATDLGAFGCSFVRQRVRQADGAINLRKTRSDLPVFVGQVYIIKNKMFIKSDRYDL